MSRYYGRSWPLDKPLPWDINPWPEYPPHWDDEDAEPCECGSPECDCDFWDCEP